MPPDVETLARMAASLAGYDPDRSLASQEDGSPAFDGPAWRYPRFIAAAEAAYAILSARPFPKLD